MFSPYLVGIRDFLNSFSAATKCCSCSGNTLLSFEGFSALEKYLPLQTAVVTEHEHYILLELRQGLDSDFCY